jgi:hypothetical protein
VKISETGAKSETKISAEFQGNENENESVKCVSLSVREHSKAQLNVALLRVGNTNKFIIAQLTF